MGALPVATRAAIVLTVLLAPGCAAKGHIATPEEIARLQRAAGLSASGRITLSGPQGKFRTRFLFGVARPDALRIEIPSGAGLRFLLVARDGRLRADLPSDDAMFEGPETREVMEKLFGIDIEPRDLVSALLGSPPDSMTVEWRFEALKPAKMSLDARNGTRLSMTLDDPDVEPPAARAFEPGPARRTALSLREMADRLGLKR